MAWCDLPLALDALGDDPWHQRSHRGTHATLRPRVLDPQARMSNIPAAQQLAAADPAGGASSGA